MLLHRPTVALPEPDAGVSALTVILFKYYQLKVF